MSTKINAVWQSKTLFSCAGIRLSWSATSRHFQSTDSSSGQGETSRQDDATTGQQNQDSHKSSTQSEKDYDRNIARQILAASIPFVNKSGWTKTALSEGSCLSEPFYILFN